MLPAHFQDFLGDNGEILRLFKILACCIRVVFGIIHNLLPYFVFRSQGAFIFKFISEWVSSIVIISSVTSSKWAGGIRLEQE